MSLDSKTPQELAIIIGEHLRRSRVLRRLTHAEVAARTGVSKRSIGALEGGRGSSVDTFVRVLKVLDKLEAINVLAPIPSVDPLSLLKGGKPKYQRVRKRQGE